MEDLTKQQIVLLTLLVSFVTSLATGIFTVTLMDQGQLDITQVINNVVKAPEPKTAAAVTATTPSLSDISAKIGKSLVKFKEVGTADKITGTGIILSTDGLIVTDKSALTLPNSPDVALGAGIVAVLSSGQELPIRVVQSEINGDVAFVAVLLPGNLIPVTVPPNTSSTKVGDNIYALSGAKSPLLETGILKMNAGTIEERIDTTINSNELLVGSPLFNSQGEVVGLKTSALKESSKFYPLVPLKAIAPQLSR
jgi:S1-C subfamily serine protease